MVPFAGFEMPISYSSIIEEHLCVRGSVGLFDISHMGTFRLLGKSAEAVLQKLTTNDIHKLVPLKAQYSIACSQNGGALDDLLVYKLAEADYMVVANASNAEKIISHFLQNLADKSALIDQRQIYAILSLQGPKAKDIMPEIIPGIELPPKRNCLAIKDSLIISRTGYTGEDGLEFFVKKELALDLWQKILALSSKIKLLPCGLGCRDTLRLEAGLPLFGHEYDEETTPIEAGYAWAVKFDKGDFMGKSALQNIPPKKKLAGLILEEKSIPRSGFLVYEDDKLTRLAGKITSGTFSPSLQKSIAMAYLQPAINQLELYVDIRGRAFKAKVIALPFYKRDPENR